MAGALVAGAGCADSTAPTATDRPAWTVPYGGEFWHRAGRRGEVELPAQIDVARVVDRVGHAFGRDRPGAVAAAAYDAEVDRGGLSFAPAGDDGAEVTVATRAVELGGRLLAVDRSEPAFAGNTAQLLLDRERQLIEHFEAGAAGVRVTWVLGGQPAEAGDWTVRVAVDGLDYLGETARGHHWGRAAGRVLVGPAELVDAAGSRWPIPVRADDGGLTLTVPADILAAARYPIALDPTISAEQGIDQPVAAVNGTNTEHHAVAFGGSGYLVVFTDDRLGSASLLATRVSTAGAVVDPNGLPIASPNGLSIESVELAFDGTRYLVGYVARTPAGGARIDAVRVATDGTVVDAAPIAIRQVAGGPIGLASASSGGGFLVGWTEQTGVVHRYRLARVASDGTVVDGSPIELVAQSEPVRWPALASNGTDYLASWIDSAAGDDDLRVARFRASDGAVIDPTGIDVEIGAARSAAPTITSNGNSYYLVWTENGAEVHGAVVNESNGSVRSESILGIGAVGQAVVGSNNNRYLAAWRDGSLLRAREVNHGGSPAGATFTVMSNLAAVVADSRAVRIATTGTDFLLTVADATAGAAAWRLVGARVTDALVVLDAPPIALGPVTDNGQRAPDVVSNGDTYLVVWRDLRSVATSRADVYGARVAADGTVIDTTGLPISGARFGAELMPRVATDGTDYLVVWVDTGDGGRIWGARVRADGSLPDAGGFAISSGADATDVAVAGDPSGSYAVVWARAGDLSWRRVSAAGGLVDATDRVLAAAPDSQEQPAVDGLGGGRFLAAWADRRGGNALEIWAAELDTGGTVGTAQAVTSGSAGDQRNPEVAGNVVAGMIVYGSAGGGLWARRWAAGGPVGGALQLSASSVEVGGFDVAAAPSNFLAVWARRNAVVSDWNLRAARITGAGMLVDTVGFQVAADAGRDELEPRAGYHAATGDFAVAYVAPAGGVLRARLRFVSQCGDGLIGITEVCDGGGADAADCDFDCTPPVCGDNYVNAAAGETCDEGGGDSATCDGDCTEPICGDGYPNAAAGEACDDGNSDETDGCLSTCMGAVCGDGIQTAGEECDDGNTVSGDFCAAGCELDSDGDSIADADEVVDDDLATPAPDSDGDATPDYLDLDSDDDTIADADEAGDDDLVTPPVDSDGDGTPDFIDDDSDGDGVSDADEAGDDDPATPPVDTDSDGTPDYVDDDSDDDGVGDAADNCRLVANPDQSDLDGDGAGDACTDDDDGDGVADLVDNCPALANPDQSDLDGDDLGDPCDSDADGDGLDDGATATGGACSGGGQPGGGALVLLAMLWAWRRVSGSDARRPAA